MTLTEGQKWQIANGLRIAADQYKADAACVREAGGAMLTVSALQSQGQEAIAMAELFENANTVEVHQ
jgi:hypothetical protein